MHEMYESGTSRGNVGRSVRRGDPEFTRGSRAAGRGCSAHDGEVTRRGIVLPRTCSLESALVRPCPPSPPANQR